MSRRNLRAGWSTIVTGSPRTLISKTCAKIIIPSSHSLSMKFRSCLSPTASASWSSLRLDVTVARPVTVVHPTWPTRCGFWDFPSRADAAGAALDPPTARTPSPRRPSASRRRGAVVQRLRNFIVPQFSVWPGLPGTQTVTHCGAVTQPVNLGAGASHRGIGGAYFLGKTNGMLSALCLIIVIGRCLA